MAFFEKMGRSLVRARFFSSIVFMATRKRDSNADDNGRSKRRYVSENTNGKAEQSSRSRQGRRDSFDPTNYGSRSATGSRGASNAETKSSFSNANNEQNQTNAYSRRATKAGYAKQRKKNKRRRIVAASLFIVLALCLVGAGAAFAYYNSIERNLSEDVDADIYEQLVKTDIVNEPFYMLLLGTDKSAEREESIEYEGDTFRSDTIILSRIDPVEKKITLVSLPRDTLIKDSEYGEQKLNAGYSLGGPALITKWVSDLADVNISHYAEIGFDGFKDVVDALGGIDVDVSIEIDDPDAGGYVAAGQQTLDGHQALILCRSRHAFDEYGPGDLYRAANQRLVIGAMAKKALSSDLPTMAKTVSQASEFVTTTLTMPDILSLGQVLIGMDPSKSMYTATAPTESAYIGDGWYEILDETAWKTMMKRVDQGLPPTEEIEIDEQSGTILATTGEEIEASETTETKKATRSGRVVVKNGSGGEGVASEAAALAEGLGYTIAETGNAQSFNYTTTLVVYNESSQKAAAEELVETLGVGQAILNDGSYLVTDKFLIVVGADWPQQ